MRKSPDRRELGWVTVGLLSFLLSMPAWALDHKVEMEQQEQESAQILATLGRGKAPDQETSQETKKQVKVELIKVQRPNKG